MAGNGQELLEAVAQPKPDVILMDCQMPVMDGFEATARLRRDPSLGRLPIIALTANAMPEERARCLAAGMDAHLAKPFSLQGLFECLAQCLPERTAQAPAAPDPHPDGPLFDGGPVPRFPGIDLEVGLDYLGGNMALMLRLLTTFRNHSGAEFPGRMAAAQAADDRRAQFLLVHSLKSLALTMGAGELGEVASVMEKGYLENDHATCDAALPGLLDKLGVVLAGLEELEGASGLQMP